MQSTVFFWVQNDAWRWSVLWTNYPHVSENCATRVVARPGEFSLSLPGSIQHRNHLRSANLLGWMGLDAIFSKIDESQPAPWRYYNFMVYLYLLTCLSKFDPQWVSSITCLVFSNLFYVFMNYFFSEFFANQEPKFCKNFMEVSMWWKIWIQISGKWCNVIKNTTRNRLFRRKTKTRLHWIWVIHNDIQSIKRWMLLLKTSTFPAQLTPREIGLDTNVRV